MRLLGDIGGTNARFALQHPGRAVGQIAYLRTGDHLSIEAAIDAFLASAAIFGRPRSMALAIAAPVVGDQVSMVNGPWSFSIAALGARLGLDRIAVLNDFEALAHALPALTADDVVPVGGGVVQAGAPRIVLGPGTGLGLGLYVPTPLGGTAIATEAGHATLAAADDVDARLIAVLGRRFGHASAERALSGAGLANLHQAVAEIAGVSAAPLAPEAITMRARDGSDPLCTETVARFFGLLGSHAGNAALMTGACGGVYVAGGIVGRLIPELLASRFRERFVDKGRYRDYLGAIPTVVIVRPDPAFLGLSRYLDRAP
ncbi:MAG: glucokinase [Alphaproteobacteria bacterium]